MLESLLSHGDALELMRKIPDKSIDHIITDPPYEENCHRNQVRSVGGSFKPASKFDLPFEPLSQETRVLYALEFVRITKFWINVFCQSESTNEWKRAIEYAGGIFKRTCVWVKPCPQPQLSGDRPAVGVECFVATYGGPGRSVWNGGGKAGVYYSVQEIGRIHPTQKPISLMDQVIEDFTQPGQIVLDPFAGSGSTLVSAKRLGRRFFGIEQDAEMYDKAVARIEATETIRDDLGIFPKPRQMALLMGSEPSSVASQEPAQRLDSEAIEGEPLSGGLEPVGAA